MKGVKGTDGVAWYWKDKARVRSITTRLPRRQIATALAVYDVLVHLCNDAGDKVFTANIGTVCQYAGLSFKTASKAIQNLIDIDLVRVTDVRRKESGAFAPRTFEILKGRPSGTCITQSTDGEDGISKPSENTETASESQIEPSVLLHAQSTNSSKEGRTKKKEEVDEDARAKITNVPTEILDNLESSLGPAVMNQDVLALVSSLVQTHGTENVVRSISETSIRLIPPSGFLSYMRRMLDSQAKNSYDWEAKKPSASPQGSARPPSPKSERQAWFDAQPMYRELTTVYSRPVQEARMRRLLNDNAPDLYLDIPQLAPEDFVLAVYQHRGIEVPTLPTTTSA